MKRKLSSIRSLIGCNLLLALIVLSASCKKEPDSAPGNDPKYLITKYTWQVEAVYEIKSNENADMRILYLRDAPYNEVNYSKVKRTFKSDSTFSYVDASGRSGSNGHYELLDNHKFKFTMDGETSICDDFIIAASMFSYKLPVQGGYLKFVYSPLY